MDSEPQSSPSCDGHQTLRSSAVCILVGCRADCVEELFSSAIICPKTVWVIGSVCWPLCINVHNYCVTSRRYGGCWLHLLDVCMHLTYTIVAALAIQQ